MKNPYIELVRPFTLISSFIAGILLYASFYVSFNLYDMILLASIFTLLQAGGQCYNQAVEEEVEIDIMNNKLRPVVRGDVSIREARLYGSFLLIFSLVIAGYSHDIVFVFLVLIGVILAWQYTDYPIRAKRFFIINNLWQAVARGFFPVITSFYFARGFINMNIFVISLVILFWVFIFQTTKDFDDIKGDKMYNIHTFPVVLGIRRTIYIMLALTFIFTFVISFLYMLSLISWIFFFILIPTFIIFPMINRKAKENNIGWKLYYITLGLWFLLVFIDRWML